MIKSIYLQPIIQDTYPQSIKELTEDPEDVLEKDLESGGEYLFQCDFDIYGSELEDSNEIDDFRGTFRRIGGIQGWLIKNSAVMNYKDVDFLDTFDAISGDLEELYVEMAANKIFAKANPLSDIYHIERVEIQPEFRGKSVGSAVFPMLYFALEKNLAWNIDLVVLKAYPFEVDRENEPDKFQTEEKRVINFYKKNGFKPFKRGCKYFYMDPYKKYNF